MISQSAPIFNVEKLIIGDRGYGLRLPLGCIQPDIEITAI